MRSRSLLGKLRGGAAADLGSTTAHRNIVWTGQHISSPSAPNRFSACTSSNRRERSGFDELRFEPYNEQLTKGLEVRNMAPSQQLPDEQAAENSYDSLRSIPLLEFVFV